MLNYTDKFNISLPLAVYLCHDEYDYKDDPTYISATSLLKPPRELALLKRFPDAERTIDISQLISSRMGNSIHDGAERAWKSHKAVSAALKAKGMTQAVLDRLLINPTDEELAAAERPIPIYLENRAVKEILGWKIGGKYDIVYNGQLSDYKSTTVWGYIFGSNVEDYRRQGSIYRWLNPEKITKDTIEIQYIFTDWSAVKAKQSKDYPDAKYLTKKYPLYSIQETENWIINKLKELERNMAVDLPQLPRCSKEELWQTDTVYKYYKNPQNITRSTKNFDSKLEAETYMMDQGGVGRIDTVEGVVKRCKYCSVQEICDQRKLLDEQKLIKWD